MAIRGGRWVRRSEGVPFMAVGDGRLLIWSSEGVPEMIVGSGKWMWR